MASLEEIIVVPSVLETLIAHGFTSEREECVGLLLGHLIEERRKGERRKNIDIERKRLRAVVTGLYVLRRSDRRSDRVEVSSEQVAGASKYLEKFNKKLNSSGMQPPPMKVIGWYHSHPHITCRPSHVDLRTQQQYQQYLEPLFFGIIVSTFNTDTSKVFILCLQFFEYARMYMCV
jgi:BRCA1/BRCA2-containing complex subunit 3